MHKATAFERLEKLDCSNCPRDAFVTGCVQRSTRLNHDGLILSLVFLIRVLFPSMALKKSRSLNNHRDDRFLTCKKYPWFVQSRNWIYSPQLQELQEQIHRRGRKNINPSAGLYWRINELLMTIAILPLPGVYFQRQTDLCKKESLNFTDHS